METIQNTRSMTQQEHLLLIRAKCVKLLELAKQRTPGTWPKVDDCVDRGGNHKALIAVFGRHAGIDRAQDEIDAAFIASAAGPFEAALASTVAAIDNFTLIHEQTDLGEYAAWDALQEILTSWPLELLQQ